MTPRILVVEDEGVVALSIEAALRGYGYTVATAGSGEEALREAAAERPHLALMDIRLAGEPDGVEVARRLQERFGVPSLFLTAYADDQTVARARESKPLGFIVKPFEQKGLHAAIEMALQLAQASPGLPQPGWMRAMLDAIPEAVVACTPDHRVVAANAKFLELIERPAGEVPGKTLAELTGIDKAEWERQVEEHPAGDVRGFRVRAKLPGGPRLLEGRSEPLTGDGTAPGKLFRFRRAPVAVSLPAAGIGLPGVADLKDLLQRMARQERHGVLGVFVLDRFHLLRRRFGEGIVRDLLTLYSVHVSRSLGDADLLFQWSDTALVALFSDGRDFDRTRMVIAGIASARLEHFVRQELRQAMVFVSAAWEAVRIGADAGAAEHAVRAFVDERTAVDAD